MYTLLLTSLRYEDTRSNMSNSLYYLVMTRKHKITTASVIVLALVCGISFAILQVRAEQKQAEAKKQNIATYKKSKKKNSSKDTVKEKIKSEGEKPQVPAPKPLSAIDDPASITVVANKTRPLQPKTYAPSDLVAVGGGQRLRSEAAAALKQLIAGAAAAGYTINPLSGYRSYATQVSVYNREVRVYGQAVADTQSARPGTSEHQTGLAIDVGGGGCGIEDCFGKTAEGRWIAANAHMYGFIIRYPEGKMAITGYRYEPWHIRYVGVNTAQDMRTKGILTLEEYFGLPAAPNYL